MFRRKTECKHPGCAVRVYLDRGVYCERHRRAADAQTTDQGDSRAISKEKRAKNPIYNHRWEKARKAHLMANPLCASCQSCGEIRLAVVVDHIVPHRNDLALFWDMNNWQSLCTRCHALKSNQEKRERYGIF